MTFVLFIFFNVTKTFFSIIKVKFSIYVMIITYIATEWP